MRSGFVALVGRPNAGKSTLLNCVVGSKVSIVSDKPQTTRLRVRGIVHGPDSQIVFVDTPGIHKAVTHLGERLNQTARAVVSDLDDLDVACLVVNAAAPVGPGDRRIWDALPERSVVVVTQCDRVRRHRIAEQLDAVSDFGADAYFAVSGRTGDGVDDVLEYLRGRCPEGPAWFPPGQTTDLPETWRVAEVVREQLLRHCREELPYSIATRITTWKPKHILCEILVERDSQRGIVIGHRGEVLKQVGIAARAELGLDGVYLELHVRVERDWQRRPAAVERVLDVVEPDGES
ncbi:MAG TPA: GTPase Era [Acidimicrobiaceae bacterium]|nr:GTPase Era [Acidimicrobiaceae bacterium]HCB37612.1 GTPase Era [Acidimicrobiaceae bacterium]